MGRRVEWEGKETQDYWHWPYAIPQDCQPQGFQRLPYRCTKGRPGTIEGVSGGLVLAEMICYVAGAYDWPRPGRNGNKGTRQIDTMAVCKSDPKTSAQNYAQATMSVSRDTESKRSPESQSSRSSKPRRFLCILTTQKTLILYDHP